MRRAAEQAQRSGDSRTAVGAYRQLLGVYRSRGDHPKAAAILSNLVRLEPAEPEWAERFAEVEADRGYAAESRRWWEQAARLYGARGLDASAASAAERARMTSPAASSRLAGLDPVPRPALVGSGPAGGAPLPIEPEPELAIEVELSFDGDSTDLEGVPLEPDEAPSVGPSSTEARPRTSPRAQAVPPPPPRGRSAGAPLSDPEQTPLPPADQLRAAGSHRLGRGLSIPRAEEDVGRTPSASRPPSVSSPRSR